MASSEVVAALNALSQAVRDAVQAAGSGETPLGVTVMQAIMVTTPVYAHKAGCLGVRFTLPAVMNPRDLIAISGTITFRATVGYTYTYTAGGSIQGYVTRDTVVTMSDVGAVDFSGTTATVASTLTTIPNPALPANAVAVSTAWSVVAFTPTSAVRYVGT